MFAPPPSADTDVIGPDGTIIRSDGSIGEDGEDDATQVSIDAYGAKLQKARDVAAADSKAIANIIKDWMNPNGS
jgi:flagellar M-ring protein FliF